MKSNRMFEEIIIKKARKSIRPDLWPEFGPEFELNRFYQKYFCASGVNDSSEVFFWTEKDIAEYHKISSEYLGSCFKIFGGDGGGTFYGFAKKMARFNILKLRQWQISTTYCG